ncbi:hypothetical protein [Enterococcus termitis]|uniref:Uncharacterized protein n=1 Tax=Enterococcus termitis TaxID=332950 RepID=A0A1E5H5H4_9ENTE|nr:hypothetical protein [Enterococcus termitis]OEG19910.1 hypothetical protein BCR25_14045 [Enterococcus termitis]OJG97696.1 hypothetical protein RV18_GL000513 [Enterococcus termitis]
MHFITERELQTTFRREPFTQLILTETERLTPGAKQFVQDKRIELKPILKAEEKEAVVETKVDTLTAYQEILSAELFEAVVLAKKKQLILGQKLLLLEKKMVAVLSTEPESLEPSERQAEPTVFHLEPIHLFSEHGQLLIKLKKIYGLICLISAVYPTYSRPLSTVIQELSHLVKQLVGDADE